MDQKNWVVPVISPYSEDHGGTLTVRRLNFTPDMPSWVSAGQIYSRICELRCRVGARNGRMLRMMLRKFGVGSKSRSKVYSINARRTSAAGFDR